MVKLSFAGFENHSFVPYPPFVTGKETLEFLTDVVLTHNGAEDRTRNRVVARQNVSYSISTDLLNRQSPFNLSLQNIRGPWAVPLWGEAQIVGTVTGTSVAVDTDNSSFETGNLALVFQNNKDWQVVQILSINNNQLVVTPSITTKRNAAVVPISSGIVRGDISNDASGYQSTYGFLYSVIDPKPYPTNIAVLFALDVSGSMAGDKIERAKAEIYDVIEALKGAAVNSNVVVDLGITLWSTSYDNEYWPNATPDDFDEALAKIAAAVVTGGTAPVGAFAAANDFFGTVAPSNGDRDNLFFFITDAGASNNDAVAIAGDMIDRTGQFAAPKDVDIYAINIDFAGTTEAEKIDNTPDEPIINVTAENPTAMFDLFIRVIEPIIGKQHKGYEVITAMPIGSRSLSKKINKIEDTVDFDLGRFETLSPWEKARVNSNHGFFVDGLDGLRSFKRFVYRRAGKHGSFYLPTFEHDLRFTSIESDGLSGFVNDDDFAAYNEDRTQLAIRFVDDTWQTVTITAVTPVGLGGFKLDFEDPVEQGLNFIERVCYMGKARFDTDRIEISFVGDNCAETSVNFLELSE